MEKREIRKKRVSRNVEGEKVKYLQTQDLWVTKLRNQQKEKKKIYEKVPLTKGNRGETRRKTISDMEGR